MDRLLEHSNASLLRMINDFSTELTTDLGETFVAVNLDAVMAENELPTDHIVGLEDFSYSDSSDPVAVVSGLFVVATSNDPNAMLRTKAISNIVDKTQALKAFDLLHADTGEVIGEMVMMGARRVPPKVRGEVKTFQHIIFEAGVQYNV